MGKYKNVIDTAHDLKDDFPKLTDFEALQIAVKMSQNEILAEGLGVTNSNSQPKFLEGIAIALGYRG